MKHKRTVAVVLALIVALVAFGAIYPKFHRWHRRSWMSYLCNRGDNIYVTAMSEKTWDDQDSTLPSSRGLHGFSTSTEYFEFLVTNKILDVDWNFFHAPGLKKARGQDPQSFSADNNAWCVVADLDGVERTGAPLLFTRNLHVRRTGAHFEVQLKDEPPFGTNGFCALVTGGRTTPYQNVERFREDVQLSAVALGTNDFVVLRP